MKTFILKLKENELLKKICYWCVVAFLFLYIFSIPSFSAFSPKNIISYLCMAGLIGFTLVYTFLYTKFVFNRWLIIPLMFAIYAFIGTAIYSHKFREWFTLILMFITLVTFYYAFVAINNKRLSLMIITFAFVAFGLYFTVHYFPQILHFDIMKDRLGGYFDNVNTIGFYFAISFNLSLYMSLFFKKKIELLFLVPAILFFVLGILTGSRAFIVALAAGGLVVLYFRLRNHKIIYFCIVAALIGLFFILINLDIKLFKYLKDQFERTLYTIFGIGNSKYDTSTIQRAIWPQYGFYLGGRNLIFGYGVNGFAIFSGVDTYAHNNYAEVICNFGIFGFILYHLCFIVPLALFFRSKEDYIQLVPILVVVYLTRSLFGVVYYAKEAYLLLALCIYLTKDCSLPFLGIKRERITDSGYEVTI